MEINRWSVHNLEGAIRASKYPMASDINNLPSSNDIEYWYNLNTFLEDFSKYQKLYNTPKGDDTINSCYYCGSSENVQKNNALGHYVCSKHNHQFERYGECFETKPKYIVHDNYIECIIYGKERKFTTIMINAIDLPLIFYSDGVHVHNNRVSLYNSQTKCSTLLYRAIYNIENSNIIVDHIDGNALNNVRSNLRICTKKENNYNKKITNNNYSDIIGVCWSKNKNKWRAYINIDYKQKHLGYYINQEDAIIARLMAEREYFKEYAPQQHLFAKYNIEPITKIEDAIDYNKDFKRILRMYEVAQTLASNPRGSAHDNLLHGILVSFDLTCTNKMWVEFERYHFADIVSSQSTMHKIGELAGKSEVYNEYTDWKIIERVKELLADYHVNPTAENRLRLLYSIPSGIELTAQVVTNYGQLKTMWYQRHNHRLPEWREFCDWILSLPYFDELTGITKETKDE